MVINRQELLKIGSQKAGGRVGQMKTYQLPSMHAAGHALDLGISFLGGILVKARVWRWVRFGDVKIYFY